MLQANAQAYSVQTFCIRSTLNLLHKIDMTKGVWDGAGHYSACSQNLV